MNFEFRIVDCRRRVSEPLVDLTPVADLQEIDATLGQIEFV